MERYGGCAKTTCAGLFPASKESDKVHRDTTHPKAALAGRIAIIPFAYNGTPAQP